MSISADAVKKSRFMRIYLPITQGCILFAIIYNSLGHGVRSPYMDCSFVFPLAAGLVSLLTAKLRLHDRLAFNALNASAAALSAGFVVKGVLDIAGTDSPWETVYPIVGAAAFIIAAAGYAKEYLNTKKNGQSQ